MRARWLLPLGTVPALHAAYAAQYLSIEDAQRAAFPEAVSFATLAPPTSAVQAWAAGESSGAAPVRAPKVWEARSADGVLGWLLVDRVIGKTELITYAVALDRAGRILALDVLEYRETHGSEIRLPAWRRQFIGRDAAHPPVFGSDVRNISGATLSCRHVTEGVQRLLRFQQAVLAGAAHG